MRIVHIPLSAPKSSSGWPHSIAIRRPAAKLSSA